MCGIVGILDARLPKQDRLTSLVTAMSDAVKHRGPDGSGVWVDPACGVGLGHRRLSIIDLSEQGRQPMTSESGRYTIVFNGEIFNFPSLREELERSGARFRGHSDTEVFLAGVERWGIERAVGKAIGMFAMGVWDAVDRSLTLVRDRLGVKPLFYSVDGGLLLFGSELKALQRHPDHRDALDLSALGLYMRYRCVPAPLSIFESTKKLPPGAMLVARDVNGTIECESRFYWRPPEPQRSTARNGVLEDTVDELEAVLRDAVRLRLIADVPLGAFLSGGVDSSLVVALMQAESTSRVKTFTVGFREASFDEAQQAQRVATQLGTDHHELYVTADEAMSVVPRLAAIYDEPFADPSAIPTILLAEFARSAVTVCLSGDGGDEQFGGYDRYAIAHRIMRTRRLLPQPVATAVAHALRTATRSEGVNRRLPVNLATRMTTLAKVLPIADGGELYHRMRTTWDPAEALDLGPMSDDGYWGERWNAAMPYWDAMMGHDLVTYLPDDVLTKVDRATMAVGLEGRVPLLDHRVVEFTSRLGVAAVRSRSETKVALRAILTRHLTGDALPRGKHGFNAPVEVWITGPLRDWAEELLRPGALAESGYLNVAAVREKWQEHLEGRRNWRAQLWSVLMFQAWRLEQGRPTTAATVS